ncbi:Maf-like protein [Pseudorhodobacter turbinis]|uniref:Nucleoside triphosphate pyrophosphatase n=1 Tax=Pseudorhodobacter turbinis TaxID=2500533 RepID=A0A4V1E0T9_9RHOB|nr:nucleoside triphosphate pyrophosphatase [Pseudorhodobacter turbinis]QCO55794.1 Maf-like protein [Pseudorhodobacter turbinis]
MIPQLILASASSTRLRLLQSAGLDVTALPARIDEESLRASLEADGAKPRDIADFLAEAKARKLGEKNHDALVLGCDQVLDFKGKAWGKPLTPKDATTQLQQLRGQTHQLLSAVVIYHEGSPIWRHIGKARLTMHDFSDHWLQGYIDRNWASIQHSAGGYLLEEEGVRLFSAVEGDYFTILGLPLLPLLGYLRTRGFLET